ncbi:uncharacterized protein LOC103848589 [Brassica rapa]|uniref:Ubiquitin-like protease family profile domain-containing protein n=1 Tax=Brassica campestris TaxID=3711 RepID=M4F2K9_BRACM|nr:uncharacterized protein LOC103848589 [Brassica rapa]XP_013665271.1 uncharacterized protein LOC106369697 [Brassica napus]
MVCARLIDCPDSPEEEEMGPIPDMLFAGGEEPVGVRVLTYQSSSALKRIFNALEEEEVDIIRRSSFGKLIEIAEKPVFSGRFARYMLSRQLKTKKKHEVWFRCAGKPVRFSLREFAIVTGLPCGKFPKKSKMKLKKTISERPYWPSLFGKVEVGTVSSIMKMLYRKTVKDREIRIKYACLALLESVLHPTSLNMKISTEHAEAIGDLEEFFSYPWERLSFDMLMCSIKERDEVGLSQNTIAVKGFVLDLQLVMLEDVPSLTEGVQEIGSSSESDSDEIEGNGRDIFTKKQNLNPAHARNVDKRGNVYVCSILCEDSTRPIDEGSCEWSDEEEDSKVDNLVALINANHEFQTSQFRGEVRKSDVDRMRQRSKLTSKGRKSSNVQSNCERIDPGNVAALVIEKITPQLAIMDKNINSACAMVDAIEGKVVVHVDDLFVKLKEEMIKCVKDMVSAMVKDVFEAQNGPSNIPSAAPPEAAALSTHSTPARDLNANTIENVLRNLSDYSTPPRSKHMTQVNLPSTNKDDVATGFVCVTPEPETCAQSANSENRTRQISLQQRLEAHKRQEHNITDEPSFSLGLTQEEMNQGQLNMVPAEVPLRKTTSEMNVDDNIAEGQVSRKSKRQRTVPSTLVDDYQCGRHIMTRVRESQKFVFPLDSISEMERKYVQLSTKLNDKFTVNVAGLFASGKDIRLILERSRFMSAKVIDILIRVVRRSTLLHLSEEGRSSVALLDTKFVAAINKTYPKFVKSRNKEGYMFPKGLRDIFPSANDAAVHPTRYYFPCNLGNKHWVGICFDAGIGVITVLDCNISLYKERSLETDLKPIVQMLPYLARFACQPIGDDNVIQCYDVARPKFVSQNKNPSDSGLMVVLLMANHAVYGTEACKNISHERLEAEGRRAAIWVYEFKDEL